MKDKKAESAIGMGRHLSMLAAWGLSIGITKGKRNGRPRRKIRLEPTWLHERRPFRASRLAGFDGVLLKPANLEALKNLLS